MGANNMLKIPLYLEAQPGLAAKPVLYLKEDMQSVNVELFIVERGFLTTEYGKACVITGTLPDGSRLFLKSTTSGDWGRTKIIIGTANLKKMCQVPGKYKCTVSILDAESTGVSEANYLDYDIVSMLPFWVVVDKAPGREGNA